MQILTSRMKQRGRKPGRVGMQILRGTKRHLCQKRRGGNRVKWG